MQQVSVPGRAGIWPLLSCSLWASRLPCCFKKKALTERGVSLVPGGAPRQARRGACLYSPLLGKGSIFLLRGDQKPKQGGQQDAQREAEPAAAAPPHSGSFFPTSSRGGSSSCCCGFMMPQRTLLLVLLPGPVSCHRCCLWQNDNNNSPRMTGAGRRPFQLEP